MTNSTRREIEGFIDADTETMRLYAEGDGAGEPCIDIPYNRETMLELAYLFMQLADPDSNRSQDGESFSLPGWFGTLSDED